MPTIRLTDDEWALLVDEPPELLKVYVELRRRMDFSTGIVGQGYRLSEQVIRETLSVPASPGRKADHPTRKKVRYAVERLCRIGALEPLGDLVFRLPHAQGDSSEQKRWGQGGAKVGPEAGPNTEGKKRNDSNDIREANTRGGAAGLPRLLRGGANLRGPDTGRDSSPDGEEVHTPTAGSSTPSSRKSKAKSRKPDHPLFERWYQHYPRKVAKGQARKEFAKLNPDELLVERMIRALEAQKRAREAKVARGEWAPEWKHPATWLSAEGWEDEIEDSGEPQRPRRLLRDVIGGDR